MKKYSIKVKFKSGHDLQFETNSKKIEPVTLKNGVRVIITDDENVLNLKHIESIDMVRL